MTKIEIVEKIAQQLGFSRKEASDHLESVFAIMKQTLASGEDLKISGFGNFEVKQKNPRRGRNPQTGEDLTIKSLRVIFPEACFADFGVTYWFCE